MWSLHRMDHFALKRKHLLYTCSNVVDLENMLREISIFITYSSGPGVLQHPSPELAHGTLITTQ